MAKTILFASGKGGVGKSTCACGVARALSETGGRTLLVDCDAGLNSVNIMLQCADRCVFSWYDVVRNVCGAEEAPVKLSDTLHVLAAPHSALDEDLENAVRDAVEPMKEHYDFILFDAPAGLGRGLRRAARAADNALIVITADEVSVRGAAAAEQTLRELGVRRTRLLMNRYDLKAARRGGYFTVDEAIDKTGVQLIGIVPEDKRIMYSTVTGAVPEKSKSVRAFRRIAERISGGNVPLTLSLLR